LNHENIIHLKEYFEENNKVCTYLHLNAKNYNRARHG
jgi:hypothetical protein